MLCVGECRQALVRQSMHFQISARESLPQLRLVQAFPHLLEVDA